MERQPATDSATDDAPAVALRVGSEAESESLSLEGTAIASIDRFLPSEPRAFILLLLFIVGGAWLAGLALAPDIKRSLASAEWRLMPFYLAAHVIAVRLFVTAFTRNFTAGVKHLEVGAAPILRGMRVILGPIGALIALVIALPFCTLDYLFLMSPQSRYERMGRDGTIGAIDLLMWLTWCIEWFLNALVWVMLLGFLVKNCVTIRSYPFNSPIEIVVHERHYRPFLQMSAQGASIVTGFGAVTILYLWMTGGELTDYVGLTITAALLVVGFVPPWLLLRRKVRAAVEAETQAMRHSLADAIWRDSRARKEGRSGGRPPLEQRLDEALSVFRIAYLEQLKLNLGRREARAIAVRLLAPTAGVAWQLSQNFQSLSIKLQDALNATLTFIGKAPM